MMNDFPVLAGKKEGEDVWSCPIHGYELIIPDAVAKKIDPMGYEKGRIVLLGKVMLDAKEAALKLDDFYGSRGEKRLKTPGLTGSNSDCSGDKGKYTS